MKLVIATPVEDFISSLEKVTIAKVIQDLELLEQHTYLLSMPYSKKLASDLYELRTRGKQEIRLFYTFRDHQIVVFLGFIKKSQKTPLKIINQAKRLLAKI
jgi:phage-related protein